MTVTNPIHPRHVVAAGALVWKGDQILLVRTPRRGWEFPGGQIEEGENILAGVLREVREEAHVDAEIGKLVGVYSNIGASRVIFDFKAQWVSGIPQSSEETLEAKWVSPAQAIELIEHPLYLRRIKQLLGFDGRVLYQAYSSNPYTVYQEQYV